MSLINQMLKDLEHRGATTADTELTIAQPGAVNTPHLPKPKLPLITIGGVMLLLAGGAYLWTQSSQAQSHNNTITNTSAAHVVKPAMVKPILAAPVAAPNTVVESPPLFETELSYNPSTAQAPPEEKKKIIANLTPTTTPEDLVKPTKLIAPNVPEKSPALERATSTSNNPTTGHGVIGKQIRPDQQSANYYRQALSYLQQGRVSEAQASLSSALEAVPTNHEARQLLAGLLLDNKRNDEAQATLAAGLVIAPEQSDFRMALARLQVEAGNISGGLITLELGLPYAKNHADYQHFLATLLQRANRHEEAIQHFTTALSLNASAPAGALISLGISLQASGKLEQSQEAFARAQSSATLSPELALFVEQRIKQINQSLQN
jgi:MSHA biogenesis protein MshN